MKRKKELIIILVPLLILTLLWVIFSVYHSLATSTITDPLSFQIIPIEGKFDNNTVEQIKNRIRVEPAFEITNISEDTSPTPTPTPSPDEETASSSAKVTPTITPEPGQ